MNQLHIAGLAAARLWLATAAQAQVTGVTEEPFAPSGVQAGV